METMEQAAIRVYTAHVKDKGIYGVRSVELRIRDCISRCPWLGFDDNQIFNIVREVQANVCIEPEYNDYDPYPWNF